MPWYTIFQSAQEKDATYSDLYDRFMIIEAMNPDQVREIVSNLAPGVKWDNPCSANSGPHITYNKSPKEWLTEIACDIWCNVLTPRRPYRLHTVYLDGTHIIDEHNCTGRD